MSAESEFRSLAGTVVSKAEAVMSSVNTLNTRVRQVRSALYADSAARRAELADEIGTMTTQRNRVIAFIAWLDDYGMSTYPTEVQWAYIGSEAAACEVPQYGTALQQAQIGLNWSAVVHGLYDALVALRDSLASDIATAEADLAAEVEAAEIAAQEAADNRVHAKAISEYNRLSKVLTGLQNELATWQARPSYVVDWDDTDWLLAYQAQLDTLQADIDAARARVEALDT